MNAQFLVEYALKQGFWFFAKPIRKCYRFVRRPIVRGVKVAIINDGRVLLVRPNYGHRRWTLPGGMVGRDESYEQAGRREVKEETGLLVGELPFIRDYETSADFARSVNKAFSAISNSKDVRVDGIEIREAAWFPTGALPADRVARVDETLKAYEQLK